MNICRFQLTKCPVIFWKSLPYDTNWQCNTFKWSHAFFIKEKRTQKKKKTDNALAKKEQDKRTKGYKSYKI